MGSTQPMSVASRTFYTNLIMSVALGPIAGRSMQSPEAIGFFLFFNTKDMFPTLVLSASCVFGPSISSLGFASRQILSAANFELVGLSCKLISILINVILWSRHATYVGLTAVVISLFAASFYKEESPRSAKD